MMLVRRPSPSCETVALRSALDRMCDETAFPWAVAPARG
jgi:hypothetical protein